MGKVLSSFTNGSPGAVSRSVDEVIISLKNAGTADIPFGAPVFVSADKSGAVGFTVGGTQTFDEFLGFAVRAAGKTPEAYPGGPFDAQPQGVWKAGDVMEILVRGAIAAPLTGAARKTGKVYIRKADGALVTVPGAEGASVELENVRIANPMADTGSCAELRVLRRNIQ